jgi:hypothetical protein
MDSRPEKARKLAKKRRVLLAREPPAEMIGL